MREDKETTTGNTGRGIYSAPDDSFDDNVGHPFVRRDILSGIIKSARIQRPVP
jgi:hypothetical protein